MAKKSLLSGSEYESIGRKGRGGGGGGGSGRTTQDKVKIGLAAGLLVVSGLILAWHFGIFDRGGVPADYEPPPPEVVAEMEEFQREIEQQIESGERVLHASE